MPFVASIVTALLLPGFAPFATGPAGGAVLIGTFPGGERPGYVYLPPGYSTAERYPVIYLLHGLPGSPSEYLAGVDLASFADNAIAAGTLRPFIAVLPAAGPDHTYNGEWAGPWEHELVTQIVPWVDTYLSTVRSPAERMIGGLSAGGFGAADIAIRNPRVFGRVLSWSGYFHPLHDGPFKHATKAELAANDPVALAREDVARLRHTRFFLSSGPFHSHWFRPAETRAFASELRTLALPVRTFFYPQVKGEWQAQVDAGLEWALGT